MSSKPAVLSRSRDPAAATTPAPSDSPMSSSGAPRSGWLGHEAQERLRCRPGAKSAGNDVPGCSFLREVDKTILQDGDSCEHNQARNGERQHHPGEFHRLEPDPSIFSVAHPV